MSEQYAVVEWEDGNDEIAAVIAKNLHKKMAEMMVRIAPDHLPREIVTMSELERMEPA